MAKAESSIISGAGQKSSKLSCVSIPSFSDACRFIKSKYSCLVLKTHSRHLALAPKYLHKKRSGIREYLDAELLKYNVLLEGVPLAYDNIKIIGELGSIYDDVGYIHIDIQADFVIFQPQLGQMVVGVVNKKSPSHIGCLIHGCFNASIPKPFKVPSEVWQNMAVNIGDQLIFEVCRLDSDAVGVLLIRGKFEKKMEADLFEKSTKPEEENANVLHEKVQNGSETAEEGGVDDTSIYSGSTSKKKRKKRLYEETLSQNECPGNKEDTNLSLAESPKKKRKKRDRLEVSSLGPSVELDGTEDNSAMETSRKHRDSLLNIDIDVSVDHGVVELDSSFIVPSSQKHKVKKKKKRKDLPDLESSSCNGIAEDSVITEDSTLEGLEADLETTKKKRKKKHKKHICDSGSP